MKKDFDEYQEDSKTLEQELDTQLKLEEQKNKDLTSCVNRVQTDNENLRVSLLINFFDDAKSWLVAKANWMLFCLFVVKS